MPRIVRTGLWLILTASCAVPTYAQQTAAESEGPRWLEVSGGILIGLSDEGGIRPIPSGLVRVNLTRRWAADVIVAADPQRPVGGFEGTYQIQAVCLGGAGRQRVRPFATIGTAGYFRSVTRPMHHLVHLSGPEAVLGGGGARIRLRDRLSVETGLQVWMTWFGGDDGGRFIWHTMATVPLGPVK